MMIIRRQLKACYSVLWGTRWLNGNLPGARIAFKRIFQILAVAPEKNYFKKVSDQ